MDEPGTAAYSNFEGLPTIAKGENVRSSLIASGNELTAWKEKRSKKITVLVLLAVLIVIAGTGVVLIFTLSSSTRKD